MSCETNLEIWSVSTSSIASSTHRLCEGEMHVTVRKDCWKPVDKELYHIIQWKNG
jgi:hypothetical protein